VGGQRIEDGRQIGLHLRGVQPAQAVIAAEFDDGHVRSVSGDTTAGGRARIDWALGDTPDVAIVELGGNDGLRGLDPTQMQANLSAILDTLAAHHVPTLLTGMQAPPNLGAAYGAQFRAVFAALSHRPGVIFDPFFLAGVAGDPRLNQADGIHPNAEGVGRVVNRITPLVEQLLTQKK
jgi:acyl-CoA thioesterase-1